MWKDEDGDLILRYVHNLITIMTKPFFIHLLLLFLSQVRGIEFYYGLLKNVNQCFEQHLSGQILMTGEVYFNDVNPIKLKISNPSDEVILERVRN